MLTAACALTLLLAVSVKSHGPPGVPPRQGGGPPPGMQGGQQQPHQQQFQQQPQHQQQFQQQPQHQQQFQQQPDVAEGHAHERGKNFKFQSEIHNADHILDHLQNVIKTKPKEQMTEEELEFHYFKMHDYDNNNKLDGVEIGKALTHFHDEHEQAQPQDGAPPAGDSEHRPAVDDPQAVPTAPPPPPLRSAVSDEEISSLVDIVLKSYDKDDDGYVEYFEYKQAQVNG